MTASTTLIDRAIISLARKRLKPFVCQSCLSKRAISKRWSSQAKSHLPTRRRPRPALHFSPSAIRQASATASVTAVNVKRELPGPAQALYQTLSALETEAAVYLDVSQLRLALRGLESNNAITRLAVLGVDSHNGARRLVKALLADPLAPEPLWERQLAETDVDDGKALLLRYGQKPDVDDRHPLVTTLSVPSSILHTHNLEIFIQTIGANSEPRGARASSFLVPGMETASSSTGRPSPVAFPVHKTLIYADGLERLPSLLPVATAPESDKQMVQGVVDGSWNSLQPGMGQEASIVPINLSLGEVAIETFRKSIENSVQYEHAWFDSGMPNVAAWVSEGTEAQPGFIKPSLKRLIEAILSNASQAIENEEEAKLREAKAATISIATRNIIDQGISIWAENAHTELRDRLNSAFVSKSWRQLKWWKLFWRVDDVGAIASDILQRGWLPEAEKEMIWMGGRLHQSGLLGPPKLRPNAPTDPEATTIRKYGQEPSAPRVSDLINETPPFETLESIHPFHPYSEEIALVRSLLAKTTIPLLQSLSQTLLLQALSTTALSSSLATLLYVSVSTTSMYEAGTIAAFGLVWSLGRMQKRWEKARTEWEGTLRENGRQVLSFAEMRTREVVRGGGMVEVDQTGEEERRKARVAVERVRASLQ